MKKLFVFLVALFLVLGFVVVINEYPSSDTKSDTTPAITVAVPADDTGVPNGGAPQPIPGAGSNDVVLNGLGAAPFVSSVKTPWSPVQAVAWLLAQVHHPTVNAFGVCEGMVTLAYGYNSSNGGWPSAKAHALGTPHNQRHAVKGNGSGIPAGSLVFYTNHTYGHVMISEGGGYFISNDIEVPGRESVTTLARVQSRWGYWPVFWTDPVSFEGRASGHNPAQAPRINPTINTHKPVVTVTTPYWPLRPGTRDDRWLSVKARMGFAIKGNRGGARLVAREIKWLRHHGFPHASGPIGYNQWKKLTK